MSAATFTAGGLLPFLATLFVPASVRTAVLVVAVLLALAATGATGAVLGGAPRGRATLRVVVVAPLPSPRRGWPVPSSARTPSEPEATRTHRTVTGTDTGTARA